ncbi:AAA family ATPase [Actinacidiphila sp. bgisy145]|uniref:helix-turn-helix transcriptional regulator n=1 Tax=Actinacidiphila sp. bgisy145 TaxID=3413792 RepID=UPI003EBD3A9B
MWWPSRLMPRQQRGLCQLASLAERKNELAALCRMVAAGKNGSGGIAFVSGVAGSGKTALQVEAARWAAGQGVATVTVSCSPLERNVPLTVIRQVFDALPMGTERAGRLGELLAEGARADADGAAKDLTPDHARVAEGLWEHLLAFSERTPVVLLLDDAQNSDVISLLYLLYFARRMRSARVSMVLAETDGLPPRFPLLRAEIMRLPGLNHIRTGLLSPVGVAELLADRIGAEKAVLMGTGYYDISGGSPLLLHALLGDLDDSAPPARGHREPVVGEHFAQAVAACLGRSGPMTREAAQWVALLGDSTGKELLAECLGTSRDTAHRLLRMLDSVGLTGGGRFRHPAAAAAVMDRIAEPERAGMQLRVARMLYDAGAPATEVASRLLGSARETEPGTERAQWEVSVLREAADRALTDNRVEEAIAWLRQAHRLCADRSERGAILFRLARIQWRHSPMAALRCLDQMTKPFVQERYGTPYTLLLVRYLLRSGRHQEAQEILHRLHRDADSLPEEVCAELRLLEMWLAVTFPSVAERFPYDQSLVVRRSGPVTGRDELQWQATRLLVGVLGGGADSGFISEVEQALRLYHVAEATVEPLAMGLSAMIFADRLDSAGSWCTTLMAEAESVDAPAWRATLAALRAEIAVRQGDLGHAVRLAARALKDVDAEGWGVEIGSPLSTLVLAHVAMGRTEEAGAWLQLPAAAGRHHGSRFALQYRYARAHHHLAADRPHAALRDFVDCGALMRRWSLDAPGLALWRVGAAEALLRLGDHTRAKALMDEQWALLAGNRTGRSAGIALRLCAAVARPEQRPTLLRQSAEILQGCGDRYELARTMADLADAHEAVGESARARHASRKALRLAQACGAAGIVSRLRPAQTAEPAAADEVRAPRSAASPATVPADPINELSRAESKVAALASMGYSNREIGDRLHVTISTVEQHLTRVYRKLNVNSREDLPTAGLQPMVPC